MVARSRLFETRLWCGTNYDLTLDWNKIWEMKHFTYLIRGNEECPKTGRKHQQWCCRFKNTRTSIKCVSKLFGKCHVEKIEDTLVNNIAYCMKGNDFKEWGSIPRPGKRSDLDAVILEIRAGATELYIVESYPRLWCQYRRSFDRYREILQRDREWVTDVRVWWGPPDSNKTRSAIEWLQEGKQDYDCVKYTPGGFFIGYNNSPNVLMDDFDRSGMDRSTFLQATDRYKMIANVKGSEKKWNPKKIAITSNEEPKDWFPFENGAVLRRITKITKMGQR